MAKFSCFGFYFFSLQTAKTVFSEFVCLFWINLNIYCIHRHIYKKTSCAFKILMPCIYIHLFFFFFKNNFLNSFRMKCTVKFKLNQVGLAFSVFLYLFCSTTWMYYIFYFLYQCKIKVSSCLNMVQFYYFLHIFSYFIKLIKIMSF